MKTQIRLKYVKKINPDWRWRHLPLFLLLYQRPDTHTHLWFSRVTVRWICRKNRREGTSQLRHGHTRMWSNTWMWWGRRKGKSRWGEAGCLVGNKTHNTRDGGRHEQTTGHAAHGDRWALRYTQGHVYKACGVLSPDSNSTRMFPCLGDTECNFSRDHNKYTGQRSRSRAMQHEDTQTQQNPVGQTRTCETTEREVTLTGSNTWFS